MSGEPDSGDKAREDCPRVALRVALRLCFAPEQADALAARAHARDGEPDSLKRLAPVVRLARLSAPGGRLSRAARSAGCSEAPLRPRPGLPIASALALALHLGLDLDGEALARLFGRAPEEIGLWLRQARQSVEGEGPASCPEFAAALGRQRDPALPRAAQLALMRHLSGCERCRAVLERDRALDDRLLARLRELERGLSEAPSAPARLAPLLLGPALRLGAVLLLVLMVAIAAVAGSRRLLAMGQAPVPLLAPGSVTGPLSGWLLEETSGGGVDAVNIASGARRGLVPDQGSPSFNVVLSPDQRRLAVLTFAGSERDIVSDLRVYRLDGTLVRAWHDVARSGQGFLEGWLNQDTLLVGRLTDGNTLQLLAFSLANGGQRVLLEQGARGPAVLSPDGNYLALTTTSQDGPLALEIRPVENGVLGAPVTSHVLQSSFLNSGPLWTPDSRTVLYTITATENAGPSMDSLALDGTRTQRVTRPGTGVITLLGLSPDGRGALYAESASQPGGPISAPTVVWQIPLDGGQPVKLLSSDYGFSQAVAAPGGGTLALQTTGVGYPPPPGADLGQQSPASGPPGGSILYLENTVTLALGPDGKPLGTLLDRFSGDSLLAWLPADALPARAPPAPHIDGEFGNPRPVKVAGATLQLNAASKLSPGGGRLLGTGSGFPFALAVPVRGDPVADVAGPPLDASWLPDGEGTIGVSAPSSRGGGGAISIYPMNGDMQALGQATFDPASLGASTAQRYRQPLVAPNGLRYSVFVAGERQVALWVGGQGAAARGVLDWTLPADAKVDPPLLAQWISNDALLVAVPEDWSGGYPATASLERVTLAADGSARVEPLLRWRTRGSERGVVLRELALSRDQSRLALRLRRFTGADPSKDFIDALVVAPAGDLTQALELARGPGGDGLSWAPDGTELVAALRGHLLLLAADGSRVDQLATGAGPVAYPLWVQPGEIWYATGTGDDATIMRVTRPGAG
ncbi:MAG TPA: hypothetical protein VFI42_00040 [Thermomicrobiaceae bacterium]|nr:hypothetical protein [Thermomicrobiaceae bacterium]